MMTDTELRERVARIANEICGCATPEQRRRDIALIEAEIDRRVAEEKAKLLAGLREPFSNALAAAYDTGATDVHNSWMQDRWGSEADFGEAASDYAASVDVQAMLAQFEKENSDA